MKKLNIFQQHIILYCKGHYKAGDFFDGLSKIWAIRCGWEHELFTESCFEYIADDMLNIIVETAESQGRKVEDIFKTFIHKGISENLIFKRQPENLSPIKSLIWEYRRYICFLQIKKEGKMLIELPKPKKRIFNRVLRGNGKYQDYNLITKTK